MYYLITRKVHLIAVQYLYKQANCTQIHLVYIVV